MKLSDIQVSQMAVLHPWALLGTCLTHRPDPLAARCVRVLLAPNLDMKISSLDLVLASSPGFPGNPNPAVFSLDFASPNLSLKLCTALALLSGRCMNGQLQWVCGHRQSYD